MLGFPVDLPLWVVIAFLAAALILAVILASIVFLSARGVYLLHASKTTAKIRLHAAVLALLVPLTLLLTLLVTGHFDSLEILVHIFGFPFGFLVAQMILWLIWVLTAKLGLIIGGMYAPIGIGSAFSPVAIILEVFLNYAGFITLVDFFTKRFGKKLS